MSSLGVSDHGGWAVFVAVAKDGTLLGRYRFELVDAELPKMPHHCEAQGLGIEEGVALVERVRESAERQSEIVLEQIARKAPIVGIALRVCPALPDAIADRIVDYRSRNVADWVMYRRALAKAAEARGWAVYWYEVKSVFAEAAQAMGVEDFDVHCNSMKKELGPPWGKDQKLAMAAAIVIANQVE